MIDAGAFEEIAATYEKHGWMLRRVLFSDEPVPVADNRSDITLVRSDIDAAWFSRPPLPGGVAWEIRYLGDISYALLEKLDEKAADFEERLTAIESRLRRAIAKKRNA
jgi:hypothetical protein